jgi:hypothetical protein
MDEYKASVNYCLKEWSNKDQAAKLIAACENLKKAEILAK